MSNTGNRLEVFEPLECCSDMQHCGPSETLRRLRADVDWLAEQGLTVRRIDPQHDGLAAYTDNPVVRELLESKASCLPLVLVNGRPAVVGRYPSREDLAKLAGLTYQTEEDVK